MRSGPPSEAASDPSTQDPLEEAVGLAIQLVQADHAVAAYRERAVRLAATVAELLARGNLSEQLLQMLLHWRLACTRGKWV